MRKAGSLFMTHKTGVDHFGIIFAVQENESSTYSLKSLVAT